MYRAFPYPTKIAPEAIALFIGAHTSPGDTVFDGFAGSGTTGLAALLCADPPAELRDAATRKGLRVSWGPRNAILCELAQRRRASSRAARSGPPPAEGGSVLRTLLARGVADRAAVLQSAHIVAHCSSRRSQQNPLPWMSKHRKPVVIGTVLGRDSCTYAGEMQ